MNELIQLEENSYAGNSFFNFIYNEQKIGHIDIHIDYADNIINEYQSTIDDIEDNIFPDVDINKKIANIEYFYIKPDFRGQHLARPCFEKTLQKLKTITDIVILRADPDKNSIQINNLIAFYKSFGFKSLQTTKNDGEIMYCKL